MNKNIYKFIFYLLFFGFFESKGQIMFVDDFESRHLANWSDTASWNITDQSPIAGKYSLHHNLTGIRSSSFISRKISPVGFNNGLLTWHFKIRNGNWIFGATEQFCFFLVSDRTDLSASSGYAIGVNLAASDNILKVCRMENGKAVQDIILTDLVWKPGMLLEVEVTHQYGVWKVRYKEGAAIPWAEEKSGYEKRTNFLFSNTGLFFKFNTAHGGQLRLDDVSMSYQNSAPEVHEVNAVARNKILILFSERLAQFQLKETGNYRIVTKSGMPVKVFSVAETAGDSAGVCLQIDTINEWDLHLTLDNLADEEGVALIRNEFDLSIIPAATFGDIVFNEFMPDPVPVVQLPEEEFIELKSTCNFTVNTKNWILEVNGKQKMLAEKIINPGNYLIICNTAANRVLGSYGDLLELAGLSLANAGFTAKLYSQARVLIDSFAYNPAMHREGSANGGYSLERIDPHRHCGVYSNWATSMAEKGGTPGSDNSLLGNNTDTVAPWIASLVVSTPSLLELTLSEIPDATSVAGEIFSFGPSPVKPDSIVFDRSLKKFAFYFSPGVLQNGLEYDLMITGLADECGNVTGSGHYGFSYYRPKPGDLLISEVLFNPFAGGVDFVEIYNHSGRKIDLAEIYIASRDNMHEIISCYPLSEFSHKLDESAYAAFTADPDVLLRNYTSLCPECISGMKKFPAYAMDEGWVVLLNKGMEIIDEFHYLENMHHPMIGDVKGISLERNSFSKASDDVLNWHSAAATAGFATPGYVNSTCEITGKASRMVSFDPKIFSPNDDGIHDRLTITLSPGEPGWMVNIRIYNENGVEIRRLTNNVVIGSAASFDWDGLKENHLKAGLGIYIITVELFRLQGGTQYFKAGCVLTDRLE